jgi:hypothetical protein
MARTDMALPSWVGPEMPAPVAYLIIGRRAGHRRIHGGLALIGPASRDIAALWARMS